MHMPMFLRANSVRPLLALSLLLGFAPTLFAAGTETRPSRTPRQSPPATVRWSVEQKDVLTGMRTLAAETRFRISAQRYEQEVRRTEPALKRARALSLQPAKDRSAVDDVIRQLQQHRAKLLALQSEMSAMEDQRETLRSNRQMSSSQFENANQKATQYTNMLASVLKTLNEMQMGVIRNLR